MYIFVVNKISCLYVVQETLKLQSEITSYLKRSGYPETIPRNIFEVVTFIKKLQKEYAWERLFDLSHPLLPLLDPDNYILKVEGKV